jgi:hypothetical protein
MFLWVELVIVTLHYQYTEDDLLSALKQLPETLQDASVLTHFTSYLSI